MNGKGVICCFFTPTPQNVHFRPMGRRAYSLGSEAHNPPLVASFLPFAPIADALQQSTSFRR
jgi:hypothetical protein